MKLLLALSLESWEGVDQFTNMNAALPLNPAIQPIYSVIVFERTNNFNQSISFSGGSDDLNVQFIQFSQLASIPLGSDLGLGPFGFTSTGELDAAFDTTNLVNVIFPVDGATPYEASQQFHGDGASASFNASLEDFEHRRSWLPAAEGHEPAQRQPQCCEQCR